MKMMLAADHAAPRRHAADDTGGASATGTPSSASASASTSASAPVGAMLPIASPSHHQQRVSTSSSTATSTAAGSSASGKLPLPDDYFRTPALNHKETAYLVKLAKRACKEVVYYSRRVGGPMTWVPLSSEDGMEVFQGVDHIAATNAMNAQGHGNDNGNNNHNGSNGPSGSGNAQATALSRLDMGPFTYLRGATRIYATLDEIADFFKLDTPSKLRGFASTVGKDLLDQKTLLQLASPSRENPRHAVSIKWTAVESPSKLARHRDFCYLECHDEFIDTQSRKRGWARSLHSIRLPFCPPQRKSLGLVRASLYRSGFVFLESDDGRYVDAIHTLHLDLKGHAPNWLKILVMKRRIGNITEVNRYFQLQRLTGGKLLGDLELPDKTAVAHCQLCTHRFRLFSRRAACRRCGRVMCSSCSHHFILDVAGNGAKKVKICLDCSEYVSGNGNDRQRDEPAMMGPSLDPEHALRCDPEEPAPLYDDSSVGGGVGDGVGSDDGAYNSFTANNYGDASDPRVVEEHDYYVRNEDDRGLADIREAKRMHREFQQRLAQAARLQHQQEQHLYRPPRDHTRESSASQAVGAYNMPSRRPPSPSPPRPQAAQSSSSSSSSQSRHRNRKTAGKALKGTHSRSRSRSRSRSSNDSSDYAALEAAYQVYPTMDVPQYASSPLAPHISPVPSPHDGSENSVRISADWGYDAEAYPPLYDLIEAPPSPGRGLDSDSNQHQASSPETRPARSKSLLQQHLQQHQQSLHHNYHDILPTGPMSTFSDDTVGAPIRRSDLSLDSYRPSHDGTHPLSFSHRSTSDEKTSHFHKHQNVGDYYNESPEHQHQRHYSDPSWMDHEPRHGEDHDHADTFHAFQARQKRDSYFDVRESDIAAMEALVDSTPTYRRRDRQHGSSSPQHMPLIVSGVDEGDFRYGHADGNLANSRSSAVSDDREYELPVTASSAVSAHMLGGDDTSNPALGKSLSRDTIELATHMALSAMQLYEKENNLSGHVSIETRREALRKMVEIYASELMHDGQHSHRSRRNSSEPVAEASRATMQFNGQTRANTGEQRRRSTQPPFPSRSVSEGPRHRQPPRDPRHVSSMNLRSRTASQDVRSHRQLELSDAQSTEYRDLSDLSASAFKAYQRGSMTGDLEEEQGNANGSQPSHEHATTMETTQTTSVTNPVMTTPMASSATVASAVIVTTPTPSVRSGSSAGTSMRLAPSKSPGSELDSHRNGWLERNSGRDDDTDYGVSGSQDAESTFGGSRNSFPDSELRRSVASSRPRSLFNGGGGGGDDDFSDTFSEVGLVDLPHLVRVDGANRRGSMTRGSSGSKLEGGGDRLSFASSSHQSLLSEPSEWSAAHGVSGSICGTEVDEVEPSLGQGDHGHDGDAEDTADHDHEFHTTGSDSGEEEPVLRLSETHPDEFTSFRSDRPRISLDRLGDFGSDNHHELRVERGTMTVSELARYRISLAELMAEYDQHGDDTRMRNGSFDKLLTAAPTTAMMLQSSQPEREPEQLLRQHLQQYDQQLETARNSRRRVASVEHVLQEMYL